MFYVIYALLFTKSHLIYKIIIPVLSIMSVLFINIILTIAITYLFNIEPSDLLESDNAFRITMLFITKITFFLFTRFVLRKVKPKSVILSVQELMAISVIFIVSVIILGYAGEVYYSYKSNPLLDKFMLILMFGVTVVDITVCILFYYIALKNKNELRFSIMKMQNEEQKKSSEAMQSIYHNLQIVRHDLKNEFLSLYNLIDNNRNEEAKLYITELSNNKLQGFHEYIKTGHEIIDALINVKLNYAREKGIEVFCHINADFNDFDTNDIICLLSNAIDNAIEACARQDNGRINLNITKKRNYLSIIISNTIESSVLEANSQLKTTKKDFRHHGLGIQSMKNIVESCDGMIDFYEETKEFFVDIMLKSSKNIPNTK